jgi:hypothetical protein
VCFVAKCDLLIRFGDADILRSTSFPDDRKVAITIYGICLVLFSEIGKILCLSVLSKRRLNLKNTSPNRSEYTFHSVTRVAQGLPVGKAAVLFHLS